MLIALTFYVLLSLASLAVVYPMLRVPRLPSIHPPEVLLSVPNYTFDFGGFV